VKWDNSDLVECCERLLREPREAARIAGRARQRLVSYFRSGGVVDDLRRLLARLDGAHAGVHFNDFVQSADPAAVNAGAAERVVDQDVTGLSVSGRG
jgi:hypothetical protein